VRRLIGRGITIGAPLEGGVVVCVQTATFGEELRVLADLELRRDAIVRDIADELDATIALLDRRRGSLGLVDLRHAA